MRPEGSQGQCSRSHTPQQEGAGSAVPRIWVHREFVPLGSLPTQPCVCLMMGTRVHRPPGFSCTCPASHTCLIVSLLVGTFLLSLNSCRAAFLIPLCELFQAAFWRLIFPFYCDPGLDLSPLSMPPRHPSYAFQSAFVAGVVHQTLITTCIPDWIPACGLLHMVHGHHACLYLDLTQ